jgi:hypothetical protein
MRLTATSKFFVMSPNQKKPSDKTTPKNSLPKQASNTEEDDDELDFNQLLADTMLIEPQQNIMTMLYANDSFLKIKESLTEEMIKH